MFNVEPTAFKVIAGAIFLTVGVAGHPARALLDSGASISVIASDFSQAVGLKRTHASSVLTDTGKSVAVLAGAVDFTIGGATLRLPKVLIADLSELTDTTGPKVDVVLGQDVIRARPLKIDFGHNQICSLGDADLAALASQGFRKIPLERDPDGRWYTFVRLPGLPPTKATVDLGSSGALMVDADFVRDTHIDRGATSSTGLVGDVASIQVTRAFSVRELRIGPAVFADVPADAVPVWRSTQPITVGLPLIRQFEVVFDHDHGALWLRQLENGAPVARDRSGILFAYRGTFLDVLHIAAHSPASNLGIAVGDHIESIDGVSVGDLYFAGDQWQWRFGPEGAKVDLLTSRGHKTITLKRYF